MSPKTLPEGPTTSRKAPKDALRGKRQALADAINRTKDVAYYTADHRDLLSLPEAELDRLLGYYQGFASQHLW